jgi:thiamine kinase-like enzyme
MAEPIELRSLQTDTSVHPAVLAWRRLNTEPAEAGEISVLQKRFKSAIYRIERLGPRVSSIVAKCCQREVAAHERVIYEEILPKLPITTPRYYGFVEGDGGYDWLFLEYAEGERYCRERRDHSALAGRWLALLHTSAERVAARAQLPELSPTYYVARLRSAWARLSGNLKHLNLPPDDLAVVRTVIQQCNFLELHWDQIDRWCSRMPRTLVHGDFKPRNVVIHRAGKGQTVLPFDWEASGWGVPAEDLAYIDLAAYHSVSRHSWPEVSMQDLLRMKNLGRIFRGISEFCWESTKFNPEWEVSAVKLQIYRLRMAEAIQMAKWEE